jgi:serine/threonine-protein kinase
VLNQISDALAAAHGVGIVHRDLKPQNVLLIEELDGRLHVKLADFGIAKAIRRELRLDFPAETQLGHLLGTPAYMSPEQVQGKRADERADLWALGVLGYEALTGQKPFLASSVMLMLSSVLRQPVRPPSLLRPGLPSALDAWFLRALSKKAADRFPSLEEMVSAYHRALEPVESTLGAVERALEADVSPSSRRVAPRRIAWTAMLAVCGLTAAVLLMNRDAPERHDTAAIPPPDRALERGDAADVEVTARPGDPTPPAASHASEGRRAPSVSSAALPSASAPRAVRPLPKPTPSSAPSAPTSRPVIQRDKSSIL